MEAIQTMYAQIDTQNKLTRFVVLLSFIITFIITRIITYLQRIGYLPEIMTRVHIHHLVPGIILVLITGYIGISFWNNDKIRVITALFFGIGAALTVDEFALWLFLKDVYWEREGRISVDAAILVIGVLTFALLIQDVKKTNERYRILQKSRKIKNKQ